MFVIKMIRKLGNFFYSAPILILWKNKEEVIGCILLGLLIGFIFLPSLLVSSYFPLTVDLDLWPAWLIFAAFTILVFWLISEEASKLWGRYKKNYSLQNVPFAYPDKIALTLIVASLGAYFHSDLLLQNVSVSLGGKTWLQITLTTFAVFAVFIYLKSRRVLKDKSVADEKRGFLTDEPIETEEEDLLGRLPFVEDLFQQINHYTLRDSFVFALYGEWGEGKTSALNLLRKKLETNETLVTFNFDPWFYSSSDALLAAFYKEFQHSLNKKYYLPNLSGLLNKYHNVLSSGIKLTGIHFDIPSIPESLEEIKARIEDTLWKAGVRVVIIIDDIDRLRTGEEIHQIFKIVKLSGKFKNTVYVLSFDPKKVMDLLHGTAFYDSSYLEKIIQAPLSLPAIDQTRIDGYFYYSSSQEQLSQIDQLFKYLEIEQSRIVQFERDFTPLYAPVISKLFTTLRRIKVYMNGLYQSLPPIKDAVSLQDFLVLEALRVTYLELYKDIQTNPWFYLPNWNLPLISRSPLGLYNAQERHSKIKDHISALLNNQPHSEEMRALLEFMFPEVRNA